MFILIWNFLCENIHDMRVRGNNIGGIRQAYKLIYVFHDVNAVLYTAYPMPWFYWKFSVVET